MEYDESDWRRPFIGLRNAFLFIFSLVLIIALVASASATNYYIDANAPGTSTTGTAVAPFQNFHNLSELVTPACGSIIYSDACDIFRGFYNISNLNCGPGNEVVYTVNGTCKGQTLGRGWWNSVNITNCTVSDTNLWVCQKGSLPDTANMLYRNTNAFAAGTGYPILGNRKTSSTNLTINWDFWYNSTDDSIKVFNSDGNPTAQAAGLEASNGDGPDDSIFYVKQGRGAIVTGMSFYFANNIAFTSWLSKDINFTNNTIAYAFEKGVYEDADRSANYGNITLRNNIGWENGIKCLERRSGGIGEGYNGAQGEWLFVDKHRSVIIQGNRCQNCYGVVLNTVNNTNVRITENWINGSEWSHSYPACIYPEGSADGYVGYNNCTRLMGKGLNFGNEDYSKYTTNMTAEYNIITSATNFITSSSSVPGERCNNITLLHNTFVMPTCNTSLFNSRIFYLDHFANLTMKDNAFALFGNSSCVEYFINMTESYVSDYNLFYAASGEPAFTKIGDGTYLGLAAWRTASGQDAHSVSSDPQFGNYLTGDYRMASSSPACNASSTGGYIGALPCYTPATVGTYDNITINFSNGGTFTFNYNGNKMFTADTSLNYINITNGTVSVLYNISGGESWALYQDPTTCVMPYEDYSPTISPQGGVCDGIYHFKDATANGAIIISGNNIILNCNNAIFFGNKTTNSAGLYTTTSQRTNITITNCSFRRYDKGIQTRNDYNIIINSVDLRDNNNGFRCVGAICQNFILENSSYTNNSNGIYGERLNGSVIRFNFINITGSGTGISIRIAEQNTINYNTLIGNSTYLSNGIYYENNAFGNSQIAYNNVSGFYYNIRNAEGNINMNISKNIVNYSGLWGISTSSNNSIIKDNHIYQSGWNSIYFSGRNHLIDSNYIDGFYHHGIDYHGDAVEIAWNITMINNYVTQTNPDANCGGAGLCSVGDACLYIVAVKSSYINNNTCINLITSSYNATNFIDDGGRGITSESQNTSDNIISNNIFINISGFCIRDGAWNNSYIGNSFTNCGYNATGYGSIVSRPLSGQVPQNAKPNNLFLNNIYNTALDSRIWISDFNVTANIYGSSPFGFLLQKGNQYSGANHWHSLSYNGTGTIFNISTFNNTFSLYNLTPPYNDIINSTDNSIIARNQSSYSITLSPNQQIEVGDKGPEFTNITEYDIQVDAFHVNATADKEGSMTVYISEHPDMTSPVPFTQSGVYSASFLISPLQPARQYFYQITMVDTAGKSNSSKIYNLTTHETSVGPSGGGGGFITLESNTTSSSCPVLTDNNLKSKSILISPQELQHLEYVSVCNNEAFTNTYLLSLSSSLKPTCVLSKESVTIDPNSCIAAEFICQPTEKPMTGYLGITRAASALNHYQSCSGTVDLFLDKKTFANDLKAFWDSYGLIASGFVLFISSIVYLKTR